MSEVVSVARLVTRQLEALGIPYVIGGSVASIAHGLVRSTLDVDLVVAIAAEHVGQLVESLAATFYLDADAVRRAVEMRHSFNLIHLATMVKVDIFPTRRPFDDLQLARRIAATLSAESTEPLWVLSAEDVILAKLDWYRQAGGQSERQWRDVLAVIKAQGELLDRAYLSSNATALGVRDLLDEALLATRQDEGS